MSAASPSSGRGNGPDTDGGRVDEGRADPKTGTRISWSERELVRKQAQIALGERRIASLEAVIAEAIERHARQRASFGDVVSRMSVYMDTIRRERDDLRRAVEAIQEDLRADEEYGHASGFQKTADPRFRNARKAMPDSLAGLKVAGIMDEFTSNLFAPSCDLLPLDILTWRTQLQAFVPDILFVESAWHGNGGQWTRKVSVASHELRSLLDWCAENGVPSVFWNKEDPVHFSTFINTARLFDHVLTTDIECIGHYKTMLGHDRVHLFPFFGQPLLHNPIENREREHAFCFAGAYYVRYPERQRDLDTFIGTLNGIAPIEIYDRNHGKDDPNHLFPESYRGFIKGSLPYEEMDTAYKGYKFGINLNSVKHSQTMFARRVFDLLLSNTHVISNYSRGVRLMFGDLVTSTDSGTRLAKCLKPFLTDAGVVSYRRMHRTIALRKVMLEHTAENRIAYLCSEIGGKPVERELPAVVVAAMVASDAEMARVLAAYRRQSWSKKRLALIFAEGYEPNLRAGLSGTRDIETYTARGAGDICPAIAWPGAAVAFFSPRDFHGVHYLTDTALAFLYARVEVAGKAAWYASVDGDLSLQDDGRQHRYQDDLALRRSVALSSVFAGSSLQAWAESVDTCRIVGRRCVSVDEFSYVADSAADLVPVLDEPEIDLGLPLRTLLEKAREVPRSFFESRIDQGFDAEGLSELLGGDDNANGLQLSIDVDGLHIDSDLTADVHRYVYAKRLLRPEELLPSGSEDGNDLELQLVASPGLRLDLVLIFLSGDGTKLGQFIGSYGRNYHQTAPEGTAQIRLGIRVQGPGNTRVIGLSFRPLPEIEVHVPQIGRAKRLLLTNVYPSATHLYRNGFVHLRVLGYRDCGVGTDVFAFGRSAPSAYEFDGVDVNVGGAKQLRAELEDNEYESILVHFLDEGMWNVIADRLPSTRIVVWLHGAEVQPWYRREFNYASDVEIEQAKRKSEDRMSFWRRVMAERHPNLHFIFVSRYFAEEVMSDTGVQLPSRQYSLIHNYIDGDLFSFVPKDPSQRLKILSIRPFASRKYANDLSVQAILALKKHPSFDKMEFRIIGDGELFEETLAPLQGLDNVVIERRFLTQQEIAELHREYGIFLCPTRMDSQGVSRDEAMSSGLVPVTNAVTAIPEFVDADSGIAVEGEDWAGLARGIAALIDDEALFLRLSDGAAKRVRAQSGRDQTLAAELRLIDPITATQQPNIVSPIQSTKKE